MLQQIQSTLFTFTDTDGGTLDAVKIISVPIYGSLVLGTETVSEGDLILVPSDFTTGLYYSTDDTQTGAYTDEFEFQVRTAEAGVFSSDIGSIIVNVTLCTNVGPTAINNAVPIDRSLSASCITTDEYTDATMFTFSDPESDILDAIEIVSVPANGTLRRGEFDTVQVGDILLVPDDFAESIFYVASSAVTTAYDDIVQFRVRTENNGVFSNTASLTFNVGICTNINELPVAVNNIVEVDRLTTYTCLLSTPYTTSIFDFTDIEDDSLNAVKILTLPENGSITKGVDIQILPGDILVPGDFPIYYHSTEAFYPAYSDLITFQVRTEENEEFSNTANLTFNVSECADVETPCITYEPYFTYATGGIGLLDVGVLTSDTATIGDYVIEWRLEGITGELKLVSASTQAVADTDIQAFHNPNNFPVVLEAGTYYPVLRWVEINGVIFHSDPTQGDVYGEDLINCVDLIEVLEPIIVENLSCANGITSTDSDYDHMISYNNEDNPPENANASLTFYLNDDGSTKYLAWSFVGFAVSDTVSFYYENAAGDRTFLESAIVGNDVNDTDYTITPVEVDYFKFDSVVNLKNIPYVFGDKVYITVTPSSKQPSNKNTNWILYLKCLGDVFTCDYLNEGARIVDPCSIVGTYSETACRLTVSYSMMEVLKSSYERTYLMPGGGGSNALEANFNVNATYNYASNYGTCVDMADTVTYSKSGNTLTIDFEDAAAYTGWKAKYLSDIAALDLAGYTTDTSSYLYYMYIRLYTYHGPEITTNCGDSLSQSNISFHRSAVPTWDDINHIVTITQAADIVNETTNVSCDDTWEEINANLINMNYMRNRTDGWTVTTKMRHSGYLAGRYITRATSAETVDMQTSTLQFPIWNIDKVCGTPTYPHNVGVFGATSPYYEFVLSQLRLVVTDTSSGDAVRDNFEVWDTTVNHEISSDPNDWTLLYKKVDGVVVGGTVLTAECT